MITLTLSGRLADFGPRHQFDVQTIAEAIHGLASQSDGFYQQLASMTLSCQRQCGSEYQALDMAACFRPVAPAEIRLVPTISGQVDNQGKLIFGLSLLGLSFLPGGGGLAPSGVQPQQAGQALSRNLLGTAASFVLQRAVADRLAPQRYAPVGQTPSELVQAPTTSSDGAAVPLIYGRVNMTSPPVISSALSVETVTL